MSLNKNLNELLQDLLKIPSQLIDNNNLIACTDLTLLKDEALEVELQQLNNLAIEYQVAACCVFPKNINHLKLPPSINMATVINFPFPNQSVDKCIQEITLCLDSKIQEIDYVLPYFEYLEGNRAKAIEHAAAIQAYCKEHKLSLKVILETGAFHDYYLLYDLAQELLALDIDFLKTSTGKIEQGASYGAVFSLLSAIKDSNKKCGIKVSGGIRTQDQAKKYASLAEYFFNKKIEKTWFRLGISNFHNLNLT